MTRVPKVSLFFVSMEKTDDASFSFRVLLGQARFSDQSDEEREKQHVNPWEGMWSDFTARVVAGSPPEQSAYWATWSQTCGLLDPVRMKVVARFVTRHTRAQHTMYTMVVTNEASFEYIPAFFGRVFEWNASLRSGPRLMKQELRWFPLQQIVDAMVDPDPHVPFQGGFLRTVCSLLHWDVTPPKPQETADQRLLSLIQNFGPDNPPTILRRPEEQDGDGDGKTGNKNGDVEVVPAGC